MRKFTIKEKTNGELAVRGLSEKAHEMYSGTDPLTIAEYEEYGKKLYSMRGCLGDKDGLTFEELQEDLEALADEMMIGETYEDPEGEWEITEVNGDQVTVKNIQEGNLNYGIEYMVSWGEAKYFLNGGYGKASEKAEITKKSAETPADENASKQFPHL